MTSNSEVLELNIPTYQQLLTIDVIENNEPFIPIENKKISTGYVQGVDDMKKIVGDNIIVRKSVYHKLLKAQTYIKSINPNLTLHITYGYRSLEIQKKRFLNVLKDKANVFYENPVDLYNAVHPFVAVPSVAGHPTGGAIDITIKNKEKNVFLDFGSQQYDYSTKNCYVFIDSISEEAKKNRMLLRKSMEEATFAPFDGEWWHFSYGDRDWAYYYKKPHAIYKQIAYKDIIMS